MSERSELRVTRGQPSADELAALVTVLWARPTGPAPLTGYAAWRAARLAALAPTSGSRGALTL